MQGTIFKIKDQEAKLTLSLMKGIISDEGKLELKDIHKKTLYAIAKYIINTEIDIEALGYSFDQSTEINNSELQKEILHISAIFPLLTRELQKERAEALSRLAKSWGMKDHLVQDAVKIAHDHKLLLYLHGARTDGIEADLSIVKELYQSVRSALHLDGDQDLLKKYQSYESFAKGTVARTLCDYYRDNNFAYPGTRGQLLSNLLPVHDFHHVLSGYNTTPTGEICVLLFDSGVGDIDQYFSTLPFLTLQYHLGVNLDKSNSVTFDAFDSDIIYHAFQRGYNCTENYMKSGYDFDSLAEENLSDVRKRFKISEEGMMISNDQDLWCGPDGPPALGSKKK